MGIIYAIFLSFWRRWFGGGFEKLPDNRFLQHIIGFLGASSILWYNGHNWFQVLICSLALQGLFFSPGHGEFFDYGHSNPPDIERYEKEWYWKYVKKIIPESEWYKFAGDYILMTVRYTLPSIVISLILLNPLFCFAGIVLSSVYALMWKFYDWWGVQNPTKISEWIVGFTTGLFLSFC